MFFIVKYKLKGKNPKIKKGQCIMKKAKIFAGIAAAAAAAMAISTMASAYTLDKNLGKNWSLNCQIPASEFADLTADSYVTITFTPDQEEEEYWSIKPMDSTWAFIDPNGEGGPELAEGKDAYPVEKDWTSISFKVPADYLDSIKEGGMIIIGHSIYLNEMTISDEAPVASEAPAGEAGDTSAPTAGDKGAADTGVEGVAVVAGLAILAAGAIAVAKKRN